MVAAGNYHTSNLRHWTVVVIGSEIEIRLSYRTSLEEEKDIDREVKRINNEVIKEYMGDYEKVRAYQDYLAKNVEYSFDTEGNVYSPHTLFTENKGVCNSYALALSRLLDSQGIGNYYVRGTTSKGGYHTWNKVKVGEYWYNIDSTWGFNAEEYGLHNAYRYFLNSDERFYKTHIPEYVEGLPDSKDKRYDGEYDGNFSKEYPKSKYTGEIHAKGG